MNLGDIIEKMELEILAGTSGINREVTGGYTCDLISDVMANSRSGQIWITLQAHVNAVAVGILRDLSAILLVNGRKPGDDALAKADAEGLPVLRSELMAFELSGRLYQILNG